MDTFAGRIGGMAARYAGLGRTLDNVAIVKKLLENVSDRLCATVAGIEQFCDADTVPFEVILAACYSSPVGIFL